tara:strand:- start:238 stop:408 length:171 start_codon:yes stop_codon:yes gene_type:complete
MNEYKDISVIAHLYKILDKYDTEKVKLYYLACAETGDEDGMSVADTILHCRGERYV